MSGICTDNDDDEHEVIAVPPKKRKIGPLLMDRMASTSEPPYSDVILQMMNVLRQEKVLCDAHLQANTSKTLFPAHKLVLASASVCLKDLFVKCPQTNLVISVNASDQAIQALLDFMYSGQLDTDQEVVIQELYTISKSWALKALCEVCGDHLDSISRQRQLQGFNSELSDTSSSLTGMRHMDAIDMEEQRKNGLDLVDHEEEEEKGVRNGRGNLMLGSAAAKLPHREGNVSQGDGTSDGELDKAGKVSIHNQTKEIGSIHMVDDERRLGMKCEPEDEAEYGKMPGGLVVADEECNQEGLDDMMLWKVKEEKVEGDFDEATDSQILDPMLTGASAMVYNSGGLVPESQVDQGFTITSSSSSQVLDIMESAASQISPSGIFYKCFECKLLFTDMQSCGSHIVTSHNIGKNTTISIETVIPTHPEDAPKSLTNPKDKAGRQLSISNGDMTLYQCTDCNKHFWSLARCQTHILSKHGFKRTDDQVVRTPIVVGGMVGGIVGSLDEPESVEWTKGAYHCYICKKTFADAQMGRTHSLRYHCMPHRKDVVENDSTDYALLPGDGAHGSSSPTPLEQSAKRCPTRGRKKNVSRVKPEPTRQVIDPKFSDEMYPFPNHPYQCNFCKNVFEMLGECEQHIHEEHNISPELVYVCYTRRKNRYKKALKAARTISKASSSTSGYDVTDPSTSLASQTPSTSSTAQLPEPLNFKCDIGNCKREIPNLLDLAYHRYLDHNITLPTWVAKYHCPVCGRMCRTKAALSIHLNSMHRPETLTEVSMSTLMQTPSVFMMSVDKNSEDS